MKKLLTKILAATFIISILLTAFLPLAKAATGSGMEPTGSGIEPATSKKTDIGEATFPVNKVLTLDNGEQQKKYFKDEQNSPLISFVLDIIDFFTTIMGTLAVILMIVAGFMLMIANGEQQTVDKAKEIVKYAIYGLVVAFMSYIIVISVQSVFIAD